MSAKHLLFILIPIFIGAINFAIDISEYAGYSFYEQKDDILLYYKIDDDGVSFKAKNNRDKDIIVDLKNLTAIQKGFKEIKSIAETSLTVKANKTRYKRFVFQNYAVIVDWEIDDWNWVEM